jgi:hypothetical protein
VGEIGLDVLIERRPGRAVTTVTPHGDGLARDAAGDVAPSPLVLELVTAVPAGARDVRVSVDGAPLPAGSVDVRAGPHDSQAVVELTMHQVRRVEVVWEGGLEVAAPRVALEPGQRSQGPRVLDFGAEGGGWLLTVEVERGRTQTVELVGTPVRPELVEGRGTLHASEAGGTTTLSILVEGPPGRTTAVVRLEPTPLPR